MQYAIARLPRFCFGRRDVPDGLSHGLARNAKCNYHLRARDLDWRPFTICQPVLIWSMIDFMVGRIIYNSFNAFLPRRRSVCVRARGDAIPLSSFGATMLSPRMFSSTSRLCWGVWATIVVRLAAIKLVAFSRLARNVSLAGECSGAQCCPQCARPTRGWRNLMRWLNTEAVLSAHAYSLCRSHDGD